MYQYMHTHLPLRHRPQYKTEWMFEFIKNANNFGLPRRQQDYLLIFYERLNVE